MAWPGSMASSAAAECVRQHPPLAVRRNRDDLIGADAEESRGAVDGAVAVLADDEHDLGSAARTSPVDVPSQPVEGGAPGDGEAHVVRHLRPGDESDR